ncbi:transcriptional regulator [Pseudidiomarina aestuarii]|uniref:Transcriptional regulator n=1 Tax=Pseudidiomarina aestuarii TaxID=624146 RepID=A0A2T4D6L3_9GAMM|nr:transcriptional regulator [Pseudidiomarina aestuarii]PTB89455.1 transcriptional regulator [Pseudidiomarina aestuarii]PTB89694.1 transcriptional regulator [Pseudidiomarina aestuarii]
MQIKKYTDYGLRILMYLAAQRACEEDVQSLTTIKTICETFDLSANHVNKVVHHLGKLGLIETKRGKFGGFVLAQQPENIRIDFVIRSLEGDESWVECSSPYCVATPACELKHIIAAGKEIFYQHLAKYTLSDLVTQPQPLWQIFLTAQQSPRSNPQQ